MAALGSLVELGHLIDPQHYDKTMPAHDAAERQKLVVTYRKFQDEFGARHLLRVHGEEGATIRNPKVVFRNTLVNMAVMLVKYKERMKGYGQGFSSTQLTSEVKLHFQNHRPQLQEKLIACLEKAAEDIPALESFEWRQRFEVIPNPV